MIATILSLNGGLLTTILCIHNQYLVTINSQIKLSVCLSVCLSDSCVYLYFPDIKNGFLRVGYMGTAFPLFYKEIMSKLSQNDLIEDLTSTECRDSCLSTNYYIS